MPPHWLHAGPRSRPLRRAGTTGGASVIASAAARVCAGAEPATVLRPGLPEAAGLVSARASVPPLDGPDVSERIEVAASTAAFRARPPGVRLPSAPWMPASRKREASQ